MKAINDQDASILRFHYFIKFLQWGEAGPRLKTSEYSWDIPKVVHLANWRFFLVVWPPATILFGLLAAQCFPAWFSFKIIRPLLFVFSWNNQLFASLDALDFPATKVRIICIFYKHSQIILDFFLFVFASCKLPLVKSVDTVLISKSTTALLWVFSMISMKCRSRRN